MDIISKFCYYYRYFNNRSVLIETDRHLRPCAHESGSERLRSQTGTDRPTVHTGSNLSAPVWLRYPYQRGTDKKNGGVWLLTIWLPCEPTDRIQKRVQIVNEANFVCKTGLSTFLCFSSWLMECRRQIYIYL